jgi:hypothetical protein
MPERSTAFARGNCGEMWDVGNQEKRGCISAARIACDFIFACGLTLAESDKQIDVFQRGCFGSTVNQWRAPITPISDVSPESPNCQDPDNFLRVVYFHQHSKRFGKANPLARIARFAHFERVAPQNLVKVIGRPIHFCAN